MNQQGVEIGSIPFTEPSQVPKVLGLLRQQAMFNTLISSCIRAPSNKLGMYFEYHNIICITLLL